MIPTSLRLRSPQSEPELRVGRYLSGSYTLWPTMVEDLLPPPRRPLEVSPDGGPGRGLHEVGREGSRARLLEVSPDGSLGRCLHELVREGSQVPVPQTRQLAPQLGGEVWMPASTPPTRDCVVSSAFDPCESEGTRRRSLSRGSPREGPGVWPPTVLQHRSRMGPEGPVDGPERPSWPC